jgi:hypothetical protein
MFPYESVVVLNTVLSAAALARDQHEQNAPEPSAILSKKRILKCETR